MQHILPTSCARVWLDWVRTTVAGALLGPVAGDEPNDAGWPPFCCPGDCCAGGFGPSTTISSS